MKRENNSWNINSIDKKKTQKTRLYIAGGAIIVGLGILASQVVPLSISFVKGKIQEYRDDVIASPVPEAYKQYIEDEFAYYDPGKSYFSNLSQNAQVLGAQTTYDPSTKSYKEIKIDREYSTPMYLTIESIGIQSVHITPNVESVDEEVYDRELKKGLAHFKGTPLPGDGGNSFIYGHSAVETFFTSHNRNPETIFTALEGIDIGDNVVVRRDDKDIQYIVRKKKIVDADDFSILKQQGDKETLTMMTCWPLGVGSKRLVVIAEKY